MVAVCYWPAIGVPVGRLTPCRLRVGAGRRYRPALPVAAVTVGGCALPVACSARVSLGHACASIRAVMRTWAVTAMQQSPLRSLGYAAVAALQQLLHSSRQSGRGDFPAAAVSPQLGDSSCPSSAAGVYAVP